jgi:hypothetical protein
VKIAAVHDPVNRRTSSAAMTAFAASRNACSQRAATSGSAPPSDTSASTVEYIGG